MICQTCKGKLLLLRGPWTDAYAPLWCATCRVTSAQPRKGTKND